MNVADQCRKMKLKVGDTIFGREDTVGYWHEARLTLLWLGETTAVWSQTVRSIRDTEWSPTREATNWTLAYRDWKKVEVSDDKRTADA